MTEVRCKKCNRLLFKSSGILSTDIQGFSGYIDIEAKCPKCGYTVTFSIINKLQGALIGSDREEKYHKLTSIKS